MGRRARLLELALLALCVGCQNAASREQRSEVRPALSASARLTKLLAPHQAGRFQCEGDVCSQPYPRLPDSGEWRCADSGGVVWCAGGEPAAGVVPGPLAPGYRCGARFGQGRAERVCIDEHPDYPLAAADHYACSFAQERGMTRICKRASAQPAPSLAAGALPACWLDEDCRSGECDRGTCRCQTDQDCDSGGCRTGVCSRKL